MTEKEVLKYRNDFPIFSQSNVAYLDNAATAQRPVQVINAVNDFYETRNANPLRGLYKLGVDATEAYEGRARKSAQVFKRTLCSGYCVYKKRNGKHKSCGLQLWAEFH